MGRLDAQQKRFKKRSAGGRAGKSTAPRKRMRTATVSRRAPREVGYFDTAFQPFQCDTAGKIVLLNPVPQGTSTKERIGKRIALKSLQGRGVFYNNSNSTRAGAGMLIVYDKRPTGVMPAITEILDTVNVDSFNKDANSGRFRILKRVVHELVGSSANGLTSKTTVNNEFYLSLAGLPTVFKEGGVGTIGDIEQGALYCVSVGDQPPGNGAATVAEGFRLRYNDV